MTSTITKTQDGTLTIKVTIPWTETKKVWNETVEEMVKNANLPGFRKGKAPKKLVEDKLDKQTIKEETLRKLLPLGYFEAVKTHNLKPIIDPKIHVEGGLDEGKDWIFEAVTCEVPEITLGEYKEAIQKITASGKIVVPGKEAEEPKFEDIVKALIESVATTIPQILLDREVDRLLGQTIDDVKKLGMSLDQYLASTGRTAESLRSEYAAKAEADIKLEFALQKVAEAEKIIANDSDIEKAISEAKNPQERQSLEQNKYLLASIIRQQKTLDFLKHM